MSLSEQDFDEGVARVLRARPGTIEHVNVPPSPSLLMIPVTLVWAGYAERFVALALCDQSLVCGQLE